MEGKGEKEKKGEKKMGKKGKRMKEKGGGGEERRWEGEGWVGDILVDGQVVDVLQKLGVGWKKL